MTSDFVTSIRFLLDCGELDAALALISANWDSPHGLGIELAALKAAALEKKGQIADAVMTLNELVANGTATFHIHYKLAALYRELRQSELVLANYRLAHDKFGWFESLANGYCFTHDYFSPNIYHWRSWFDEHITSTPIEALEIGSWQGGSATWLLDKVISVRGGRLTCIDTFEGSSEHAPIIGDLGNSLETIFDQNVLRTGQGDKLRKLVGYSQQILPTLWGEKFDFIYIDGAHEAKFVIQDAIYCWGLLRPGGFLLFDDVNFVFANYPEQNTSRAIDFFLSVFSDDLLVVDRRHQILIKRRG